MLKKILSISGRPGLYRLVNYGKNLLVVETLSDGKRLPIHSRDKVMSLGDISIYTQSDDVPLNQVFEKIAELNDNKEIDSKQFTTREQLAAFIEKVLPNYDRDRVHNSDIKKIISWYNILIGAGITDFSIKEEQEEDGDAPAASEEKVSNKE